MPLVRAASIRAPLPGLYNPELHELSIRQARHTTRQWAWIRAKTADNLLHCVPSSPLGAQALTRRRLGPAAYTSLAWKSMGFTPASKLNTCVGALVCAFFTARGEGLLFRYLDAGPLHGASDGHGLQLSARQGNFTGSPGPWGAATSVNICTFTGMGLAEQIIFLAGSVAQQRTESKSPRSNWQQGNNIKIKVDAPPWLWLPRWPKPSCTQAAHFTHPPIKCHHKVCWPGGAGAHESQNLFPKVRWRNRRGSPRLIALLNKKISRCTQQSVTAVELPRLCKDLPRSSEGCLRRPSLDQFLGIPKLTNLLLSDRIIFQCLSRSASASWSSFPSAVNGVSRLGARAALLGVMDLEWPSNMSVTIFNSLRSWRSSWPPMFCKALIIPPAWEASSWQSEKCFPETRSNRISSSTPVALSKLSLTKAMGPVGTDTTHSSSKSSSCKNPTSQPAFSSPRRNFSQHCTGDSKSSRVSFAFESLGSGGFAINFSEYSNTCPHAKG